MDRSGHIRILPLVRMKRLLCIRQMCRGIRRFTLLWFHPDLDGEIYLKSTTVNKHDVNGDGVVNILDLVAVANGFGTDAPDLNGDGVVNIQDLVIVANAFGQ